jgi:DNA-binding IclR family transcriptional regulator
MSKREIDSYFQTLPANDGTDRAQLDDELAAIRTRGWSVSHGEVDQGIWAAAAPVADGRDVVGALTAAGLAQNIDDRQRNEILEIVRTEAQHLSKEASLLRV